MSKQTCQWSDILKRAPEMEGYPGVWDHSEAVATLVGEICADLQVHPLIAERAMGLAWLHDCGKAQWLNAESSGEQHHRPDENWFATEFLRTIDPDEAPPEFGAVVNLVPYLDADVLLSCQFISLPFEPKVVFWADLHCLEANRISLEERKAYIFTRYFDGTARESEFVTFWEKRSQIVQRFDELRTTLHESANINATEHLTLARTIGGWLYKGETDLLAKFSHDSASLGEPACEIGSWRGRSSICIAGGLAAAGSTEKLYCVDDWQGGTDPDCQRLARKMNIKGEFLSNTQLYADRVVPVQGLVRDIAIRLPKRFSMVFLDGDHSAEAVEWEHEFFAPRIVPGGHLVFHDTDNPAYPAVRRLVDTLLASGRWEFVAQASYVCGLRKLW
jgi:hypothetical protein